MALFAVSTLAAAPNKIYWKQNYCWYDRFNDFPIVRWLFTCVNVDRDSIELILRLFCNMMTTDYWRRNASFIHTLGSHFIPLHRCLWSPWFLMKETCQLSTERLLQKNTASSRNSLTMIILHTQHLTRSDCMCTDRYDPNKARHSMARILRSWNNGSTKSYNLDHNCCGVAY
jgi:hypothetical protein